MMNRRSLQMVETHRFIVYMIDPPALASGCNPKRDNRLNDCIYQCLYYAYGTFFKLTRAIEKPDILKKALGLQRADPVPVSCIEIVECLARTIAINITGDITRMSSNLAYRRITLILTNGHYSIMPILITEKLILLLLSQKSLLFIRRMG